MDKFNQTAAIYQDPDQEAVRRDLEILFGPNSDFYLKEYEVLRQRWFAGEMLRPSWNWSAFFGSIAWFFYRKLYGTGAFLLAFPIFFELLSGNLPWGLFAGVMMTAGANLLYVDSVLRQIIKADAMSLQGEERAEYLRRAGGVSQSAGIAVAVFMAVLVLGALAWLPRK